MEGEANALGNQRARQPTRSATNALGNQRAQTLARGERLEREAPLSRTAVDLKPRQFWVCRVAH